jgi:hypothetical protein
VAGPARRGLDQSVPDKPVIRAHLIDGEDSSDGRATVGYDELFSGPDTVQVPAQVVPELADSCFGHGASMWLHLQTNRSHIETE